MPRKVPAEQKAYAVHLMQQGNMSQRQMEKETGLSRPYLRKIADSIGYQFPRNGIEVLGQTCMCNNCGIFFRRPPSKVKRATKQFCDDTCKFAWMKGPLHPAWKTGKTAQTFSTWVKNQASYHEWREGVLAKDGYRCVISGRTDNLECHHVLLKSEKPEESFNVQNGLTLNAEVHQKLHQLVSEGYLFDTAVIKLQEIYGQG